jgi:hypothetical protein
MKVASLIGIFETRENAHTAIQDLIKTGFERKGIGLVTSLAEEARNDTVHFVDVADNATYTADSAVAGAGYGAAIGGLAGVLLGLTTLAVPGVGPLVIAGSLALGVTGAGLGALEGLFFGAVTHLGIAEHHLPYYKAAIRRGKTLVSVIARQTRAHEAEHILRRHQASEVHSRIVQRGGRLVASPVQDEETSIAPRTDSGLLST